MRLIYIIFALFSLTTLAFGESGAVTSPRYYCSLCGDGSSHTVGAITGVSTLVGLANYDFNGKKPYSFINSYPFGVLFNLIPETDATNGATTLTFKTTATIGTIIASTAVEANAGTTIQISDKYVTNDMTVVGSGVAVAGAGIQANTTLTTNLSGTNGQWTATISPGNSGGLTNGEYLTFSVQPASGSYVLPIVWASGVNQGDTVTAASGCIPAATQIDYVNPMLGEIHLSQATIAQCAANDTLTFVPSWLANVRVGMNVQGPSGAVAANTTVSNVNAATGVVTLSQALTGNVYANAPMLNAGSWNQPTPITFWRAYTDSEATGLQMDRLAIQAAVNAANGGLAPVVGGDVVLPVGSNWLLDGPVVLPIIYPSLALGTATGVGLGGVGAQYASAVLYTTQDFGPGNAAISCGDPTAHSTNLRGLYAGASGYFCPGRLHGFRLSPQSYVFAKGLRPTVSGTPIAMDGIKQGPRLAWDGIQASGYRCGTLAAMDHTPLRDSVLLANFNGFCLDDQQPTIWGDWQIERLYAYGNAWANWDISATNWVSGELLKNYYGFAPYAIYCEPAFTALQCMQGVNQERANMESVGCGAIKDGGIRLGFAGAGSSRDLVNIIERNVFHSRLSTSVPPGAGCEWDSYYDIRSAADFTWESVWQNDFAAVTGAYAYIMRATRIDNFATSALKGGVTMQGTGVWQVIQIAQAQGEDVIGGINGQIGGFYTNSGPQLVKLIGPGFMARPMVFTDASAASLPIGTLLCYNTSAVNSNAAVGFCGRTADQAIAGTSAQAWASNPQTGKHVPVVYYGGDKIPLLTTTNATVGGIYKVSAGTPGSADVATGMSDGQTVGLSHQAAGTPLTYVKPLWAGAGN